MIDVEGFKIYLHGLGYTPAVVRDICSRAKRADKIQEFYSDDLYLYYLEKENKFQILSTSIKSQLRKAVRLYTDYTSLKEKE